MSKRSKFPKIGRIIVLLDNKKSFRSRRRPAPFDIFVLLAQPNQEDSMDFAIYPFKRYGQYRLYVVLTDEQGKEVRRSTGVTYPANASKKTKREAREQATQKANEILLKYFKREAKKKTEPHMERLSTYLDAYYFPRVKANCKPSTLLSYRNALKYFMGVCGDKKMDEYKRFDFEKYKNHRLINENIAKTTINIELRSIKAAFN